jgi:hypothetical protein
VVISSFKSPYNASNLINCCSTSETPRITGNIISVIVYIDNCVINSNDNVNSYIVSEDCSFSLTNADCNSGYHKDGPCNWELSEEGVSYDCVSNNSIRCHEYLNKAECKLFKDPVDPSKFYLIIFI